MAIMLIASTASAFGRPQSAKDETRSGESVNREAAILRHLTTIRAVENSDGVRVVIGASSPITDAVSYRSAGRFVVVIPQAESSALQIDMRGLTNLQIDTRDDDVTLSFRVDSITEGIVTGDGNQLVIAFHKQSGTRAVVTAAPPAIPVAGSQPTARSNASAATPSAPAAAVPQTPSLADIVETAEKLFGTKSVDVANLDLNTPESPAFAVLDLTPQTVLRPSSPKEFVTGLLNGLDKNGNFQTGLAIDTAPYLLFNGQNVNLDNYKNSRWTRFITRTQFSFAVAKGTSNDDPTAKLALGLNLTLHDAGDPRIYRPGKKGDVLTCFDQRLNYNLKPVGPQLPGESDADHAAKKEAFQAEVLKASKAKDVAEQCREEGRKANWNQASWTVGFAPSWLSKTGNSSDFKWNGGALWTSYAHGVGDSGQFIVHARFRNKEQVPDPVKTGSFIVQDSAFFGARFRMGGPDFGFNLESAFVHNRPENKPSKNTYEFSIGAEKKLAENVYLVISAGSKGPQADNTKSHGFVITSFKYGFSKKPQIVVP
jgi:hypothetical protein